MSEKEPVRYSSDTEVLEASRRYTRRSFAAAALAAAAGYSFSRWVYYSPSEGEQPLPRRRAIQFNAKVSQEVFNNGAMAPTYAPGRAEKLRINGLVGLKDALLPESWRLQLVGAANATSFPQYVPDVTTWDYKYMDPPKAAEGDHFTSIPPEPPTTGEPVRTRRAGQMPRGLEEAGTSYSTVPAGTSGLLLTMADILRLPKHELVTEFKCVEGWSQIAQWNGVRMADFIEAYPPPAKADGSLPRYVYMETPSGDYYVGYDMHVCQHPQTLLVTEMAGVPLTQSHGAPLRLHTPAKYGYKQIKRIGLIAYTDVKPDDYWTKLGYDWDAGL